MNVIRWIAAAGAVVALSACDASLTTHVRFDDPTVTLSFAVDTDIIADVDDTVITEAFTTRGATNVDINRGNSTTSVTGTYVPDAANGAITGVAKVTTSIDDAGTSTVQIETVPVAALIGVIADVTAERPDGAAVAAATVVATTISVTVNGDIALVDWSPHDTTRSYEPDGGTSEATLSADAATWEAGTFTVQGTPATASTPWLLYLGVGALVIAAGAVIDIWRRRSDHDNSDN